MGQFLGDVPQEGYWYPSWVDRERKIWQPDMVLPEAVQRRMEAFIRRAYCHLLDKLGCSSSNDAEDAMRQDASDSLTYRFRLLRTQSLRLMHHRLKDFRHGGYGVGNEPNSCISYLVVALNLLSFIANTERCLFLFGQRVSRSYYGFLVEAMVRPNSPDLFGLLREVVNCVQQVERCFSPFDRYLRMEQSAFCRDFLERRSRALSRSSMSAPA
ncbi:hypothetical protein KP509_38G058700 [Ceratopteris richardii]|uniref:Uncharacterized protein n=1 Tax=Ceratopteris richardii TaxID=49495 RepID=A0A8T2Q5B6_CERRI|nr:hypothetical protein KP509_38G058700 [Ceratopteris richardii]